MAVRFHSLIIDGALEDFEGARRFADTARYADVVNPVDGVSYPGICTDLPDWLRGGVADVAACAIGTTPKIHGMFLRLSLAGAHAPHQAHNDATMGAYSLMLYMNRREHCAGGTALLRHKMLGMEYGPRDARELEVWKVAHSVPDVWKETFRCPMRPNRAFIFDASMMHRAEPIGGYGYTPADGRLVLTAFFS